MYLTKSPRPRLMPDRKFPAYAYLPGRFPHPVRHPLGHSYGLETGKPSPPFNSELDELGWGIDPFNHGYYWEAHEAWEGLWQSAKATPQLRLIYKGLILLAAAGVKVREGKLHPARRHAARAAVALRIAASTPVCTPLSSVLGTEMSKLADYAAAVSRLDGDHVVAKLDGSMAVFARLPGPFNDRSLLSSAAGSNQTE